MAAKPKKNPWERGSGASLIKDLMRDEYFQTIPIGFEGTLKARPYLRRARHDLL